MNKPDVVAANPVMSAKWDELTKEREFASADIPVLELLCYWYAVVDTCERDLQVGDQIQVAYSNDLNDIKALPQVGMLKQASAEIRALNKQLGINDQSTKQKRKGELGIIPTRVGSIIPLIVTHHPTLESSPRVWGASNTKYSDLSSS